MTQTTKDSVREEDSAIGESTNLTKYAICNELYVGWPLERAFEHASGLGYTGVEIAPFTLINDTKTQDARSISSEQCHAVRRSAEARGLEVIGLHWLLAKTDGFHLTSPDTNVRKRTGAYLCTLAEICHNLGGKVMVFGSPKQRNLADGVTLKQGFDFAVDLFKSVANRLEDLDVVLALEPLGPEEGNFILTAESGIQIASAVDSPAVKLHLDVKAMSSEKKSIPEIIKDSRDWLVHFHANDPNRRGPGMGEVEFAPILSALDEVGYDGWLSVEVFDYEPGIDALASQSIRCLQSFVNRTSATD